MVQATSPTAVRSLLGRYDLAPRKRLGQHFLWQQRVVKRMADAAELDAGDLVLEIGPGLGILTEACAERAGLVIAVEVDRNLFPLLEAELGLIRTCGWCRGTPDKPISYCWRGRWRLILQVNARCWGICPTT